MPRLARRASQRSHLGGHKGSGPYAQAKQAPYWTYGSALAFDRLINKERGGLSKKHFLVLLSADPKALANFTREAHILCPDAHEVEVGLEVINYHLSRMRSMPDPKTRLVAAKSLLRAIGRKSVPHDRVATLEAPPLVEPTTDVSSYKSVDPSHDRARDSRKCKSIAAAVKRWKIGDAQGAIVPERAKGRERTERGGRATPAQAASYVHYQALPPLTTNRSDQWYWPKDKRYFSVEEAARGCHVSDESPLHAALGEGGGLTASQAISALGNGVHGAPMQYVINKAIEGMPASEGPFTYASGFTGIDTAAAAFEEVARSRDLEWSYKYAAESEECLHAPLLAAWGRRGLTKDSILGDVRQLSEAALPRVDLLVLTPCCRAFSPRNHKRKRRDQAKTLAELHAALKHARARRPGRIIIENVPSRAVTTAINAIAGDLREYEWSKITLCPYEHFGLPSRRKRRYWIGVLKAD